uniref:RGS domain-containing protein n=1 Tax=Scophthalmus maximus TaxID=52904 RepID=A0A8D3AHS6_SCOMX
VEEMLQALHVDSHAGLYFTHFCVQSGNQLWENTVYFWTDLQHYHELFYQDGLDTYRVQREAQLLYSTYLSTSARRSVGVDEEIRRKVYERLMPAFEELLDEVEEHTLDILLQPWMLLHSRDKDSFQKVAMVTVCDEGFEPHLFYLYSLILCILLPQMQRPRSAPPLAPPFSKGPQVPDAWANVSPSYQGYRLGSLLRQPPEVGHFMSFLQEKDSSIHLACWLDLEQYKRTPQKDRAVKHERTSHLWTKYLNRKYFFGYQSPATMEQQNNILHLTGGLGMKISNLVVVEIQEIVRNHIEEKWLPRFLSTAEFTERQRKKAQVDVRLHPTTLVFVADHLWMSSSKEILLFRQILLNPVTCMQFQHFVSPRGDLLEKDLLFWLEVQKYKDLCHSHSDEATIQQKISTIIDCFINSSMPPTLQIDVPPEQARRILEERHELGPYIFREAQSTQPELCRCRRSGGPKNTDQEKKRRRTAARTTTRNESEEVEAGSGGIPRSR